MTDPTPAVSAANELTLAVGRFNDDVTALKTATTHNRRLLRVLGASLCFDLLLSVCLGLVAMGARDASSEATRATSAAVVGSQQARAQCESSNTARRANRDLWTFVFTLPTPTDETPAARDQRLATTHQFNAYLDRVTVQRDCSLIH